MVLTITENKGYKNINLKEKTTIMVEGTPVEKYVLAGKSVIVEKTFKDGKRNESKTLKDSKGGNLVSYSCAVNYDGEPVSFWLDERQHDAYKVLGDIGSKIKISGEMIENKSPKARSKYFLNITFELA